MLIASAAAERLSEAIGFDVQSRNEIVLAVRELATNIVRHAGSGDVLLTATDHSLVVVAEDHGPGIADVHLAVQDGYSTAGSLGYGLGTVNRLMHEMTIDSVRGRGTIVTARRDLRVEEPLTGPSSFDIGVATSAKPGFDENGDAFVVHTWDDQVLAGVIDGVGHGGPARVAAQAARRYVETHFDQPLGAVFSGTDVACRGTRGVVMALARLDRRRGLLEHGSIGNIETRVLRTNVPVNPVIRRGILGINAPAVRVVSVPWPTGAVLVMHSDGIVAHWGDAMDEMLAEPTATRMAATLLARLNRGNDDATVVVLKDAKP